MTLSQQLHDLCIEKNVSIAVAESCTTGGLSSSISSVAGASNFFKGGIIAYQNKIKIGVLGVSESIIREKTEVCVEVVEQMSLAVRNRFSSDFSIATSGYAGPTGGTELHPIGTVFIAISSKNGTVSRRFFFQGERSSVISQVIVAGIQFLLEELKNQL